MEKTFKEVQDLLLDSGIKLSKTMSVQPNILVRTPVFSPIAKTDLNGKVEVNDLSEYLTQLSVCQKEGFDYVLLKGIPLNIETDFRVWCGVMLTFSIHGLGSNRIRIKFSEFAKYCGFTSKRIDKELRERIDRSLSKIQEQKLTFRHKSSGKVLYTGLLFSALLDANDDHIELKADERLWDLYEVDNKILISLSILKSLPRSEVAQCLYIYFVSLPNNPYPVSFSRLRDRLQLNTVKKESNRRIKDGIKKLEKIGFLEGNFSMKDGETYYLVHKRNKKLP